MKIGLEAALWMQLGKFQGNPEINRCILLEVGWILINLTNSEQASYILFAQDSDEHIETAASSKQPRLADQLAAVLKNNKRDFTILEFYLTTISNVALEKFEIDC